MDHVWGFVRTVDRALNCLDMFLWVSRGRCRDDQFEKDQPRFAVICADATKNATMNRALEWYGVSSPFAASLFSSISGLISGLLFSYVAAIDLSTSMLSFVVADFVVLFIQ